MRLLRFVLRIVESIVVMALLIAAAHRNDPMLVVAAFAETLGFESLMYWLLVIERRRSSR